MSKQIQDKFTGMAISRQRKYQLRREARGLCRTCGSKAVKGTKYCLAHREKQREWQGRSERVETAEDMI